MSEEARQVVEDGAFTLPEVIAEVVYVLKGVYKIERDEIGRTLIDFLDEVAVENQDTVCEALSLFSETFLDFVDCILIARHGVLGDEIVCFMTKTNNTFAFLLGNRLYANKILLDKWLASQSGNRVS